mmetsp:Transcript_27027/g.50454  ORF Transcript_27027/g.50454 Transcript_27027/m.50454 type:complete len:324 (-) Transcript_27027:97-1068(-)|eukprot:CAMPEP_0170195190 /NCGR_PEP_ID=MMETSP0040_2-20121228/60990_1 /TAXON_ID=641309 /ORGANISM="Lotharella oceanica, Strain CCMP622" /LENGTH=323 /DNA_ID=CAMNT_0010444295 /DNA_START=1 /DNA_END=972 /DNA_ORIENTATION=+
MQSSAPPIPKPPAGILPPVLPTSETVEGEGKRGLSTGKGKAGAVLSQDELKRRAKRMDTKIRERTGEAQKPWDLDLYEPYYLDVDPSRPRPRKDGNETEKDRGLASKIRLVFQQDSARIWDGGLQLGKFFADTRSMSVCKPYLENKNVVELGCGGGIAGMALGATGIPASVAITDLQRVITEDAQPNLDRNEKVLKAHGCPIRALPFVWGETEVDAKTFGFSPDILIGADLVRNKQVGEWLLKAIDQIQKFHLQSKPPRCVPFLYCYGVNRQGLDWFLKEMRSRFDSCILDKPSGGFDIPHCKIELFRSLRKNAVSVCQGGSD